MIDRYEQLDGADRWFFDILRVQEPAGFFVMEDVEMTKTKELIAQMRQQGIKGTYTHIVLRATALAFTRHPEFNRLIIGKHLVYPGSIDLGLTVGSDAAMAGNPTMILHNMEKKTLMEVTREVIVQAPIVRQEFEENRRRSRKLVRVIPFGFLRRWLVGRMKAKLSFVREKMGTFHVTTIPHLRYGIPFVYPGTAALTLARVEDRVIVKDNQPAVRPMTTLGIVGDHRIWNGDTAAILLNEIKKILEEGELATEISIAETRATQRENGIGTEA